MEHDRNGAGAILVSDGAGRTANRQMKTTNVGLAESRVSRNPDEVLTAIGLGSCVALVAYEPVSQVGALVHIMLPQGPAGDPKPAKYAETAVPYLLEELTKAGVDLTQLRVALFGGATLLTTGQSALLEIGQRNITAAAQALEKVGLTPVVEDVGGTKGRNVQVTVGDGTVTVKVLGQPDRIYCELADSTEVPR